MIPKWYLTGLFVFVFVLYICFCCYVLMLHEADMIIVFMFQGLMGGGNRHDYAKRGRYLRCRGFTQTHKMEGLLKKPSYLGETQHQWLFYTRRFKLILKGLDVN